MYTIETTGTEEKKKKKINVTSILIFVQVTNDHADIMLVWYSPTTESSTLSDLFLTGLKTTILSSSNVQYYKQYSYDELAFYRRSLFYVDITSCLIAFLHYDLMCIETGARRWKLRSRQWNVECSVWKKKMFSCSMP